MANWFPARRVLGLPAGLWVVLPVPLLALGNVLWKVWPPSTLAEPSERAEIFRDPILVAREGDSFRFVPRPKKAWKAFRKEYESSSIRVAGERAA